jgi:hypothetical protein
MHQGIRPLVTPSAGTGAPWYQEEEQLGGETADPVSCLQGAARCSHRIGRILYIISPYLPTWQMRSERRKCNESESKQVSNKVYRSRVLATSWLHWLHWLLAAHLQPLSRTVSITHLLLEDQDQAGPLKKAEPPVTTAYY